MHEPALLPVQCVERGRRPFHAEYLSVGVHARGRPNAPVVHSEVAGLILRLYPGDSYLIDTARRDIFIVRGVHAVVLRPLTVGDQVSTALASSARGVAR